MADGEQDRGDGDDPTEGDEPTPGPKGEADAETQEDAGLTGGSQHTPAGDDRVGDDEDDGS